MIELDEKPGSLNVLSNVIGHSYGGSHLPDQCYVELKSKNDVSIQVLDQALTENGPDWPKKIDKEASKLLLSVIALFEYLEEQKLAHFIGTASINSLGMVQANAKYTRCEFLDNDLKPLVYRFSRTKIFVSETLRVFAKNGFRTDEEIRQDKELSSLEKQLNVTRIALFITILGLIASILVPVFVTSTIHIKNDMIVTKLSLESINAAKLAIVEGARPLAEEITKAQVSLSSISNSIEQAVILSSLEDRKLTEALDIKLDELSETLDLKLDELSEQFANSITDIEKLIIDSHSQRIQPPTKSDD